jgi:hypothetical protein
MAANGTTVCANWEGGRGQSGVQLLNKGPKKSTLILVLSVMLLPDV